MTHICNKATEACGDCWHAKPHYPVATDDDESTPCTKEDDCARPYDENARLIRVRCVRIKEE